MKRCTVPKLSSHGWSERVVHARSVRRLAEHSWSEENLPAIVETPQRPKRGANGHERSTWNVEFRQRRETHEDTRECAREETIVDEITETDGHT